LTGDALAAKELLRHKNLAVTTDKYVKAIPEALLKGIKLLEAAASDGEKSLPRSESAPIESNGATPRPA
jgi:hypothetical protein